MRLALLLAALAAAGPMPSVRAVDAGRVEASIAWFRSERAVREAPRYSNAQVPPAALTDRGFHPHPAPRLSLVLPSHSLFHRPPPLQN
jgi:hypothetical protein